MSDDQELLEFGTIDVFYVVWEHPNRTYFLKDMSPDFDQVEWTPIKRNGFYFYTDKEASKIARILGQNRQGVGFETGEIDILDDLDLDDFP